MPPLEIHPTNALAFDDLDLRPGHTDSQMAGALEINAEDMARALARIDDFAQVQAPVDEQEVDAAVESGKPLHEAVDEQLPTADEMRQAIDRVYEAVGLGRDARQIFFEEVHNHPVIPTWDLTSAASLGLLVGLLARQEAEDRAKRG